jgi:MarR family.
LIFNIESYLQENIDDEIIIKTLPNVDKFPIYLRESYNFYELVIFRTRTIFLEVIDGSHSIDQIRKHINQIIEIDDCQIVLYYKDITRYRRKSLIKNRVAFVVENGQMYLPFLGLDLKKTQEYKVEQEKRFTATTQIMYLYFLYNKEAVVNNTELAEKLGFNTMTASRALNDLRQLNLITYKIGGKTGRSKEYKRILDPDYFMRGLDYLKTPVRKTVYTKLIPPGTLTAGLEALAQLSMINPPDHPIVAMGISEYNREMIDIVKDNDLVNDEKLVELQLWNYNPKLFSDKQYVDLLSLYISLKENADERVEQALEEALRDKSWYMD